MEASVDTRYLRSHLVRVMAKSHKVEEPAASSLTTPKPAKPDSAAKADALAPAVVRYADDKTVRKAADKVFEVHKDLLRRLAQ